VYESWPASGFQGHCYLGRFVLPGRYVADGVTLEALPHSGRLTILRLAVIDARTGRPIPVTLPAAFVSDSGRLAERAATPGVRLYEVVGGARAFLVGAARVLPDDAAVLNALAGPEAGDPRETALLTAGDAHGWEMPPHARPGRADVVRAAGGQLDVRAEGPGLLVVTEGWDLGWSALVDDQAFRVVRLNHAAMGVPLLPGRHRVVFTYRPPGFLAGVLLSLTASVLLLRAVRRGRPAELTL
jgi:hypothetical protein